MLGGVVSAENLIVTIYSDKWADASLYFKLACFIGVMYPLHFINLDILRVFKKSELFFRLEVIKRLCFLLAFLLTFRWGIKEMMIGQIVVNVISVYLNSYYSGKLIYYKVTDQLKDILPSFFGAIIMAILIYPINYISFERPICFLLQFMCGVFIYLFVAKLFKNESLFDLISLIKERKII
jgi:O-antigen/teichoic acid export membrane protein